MAHVDLLLADHAQVAEGRLFVMGAGLDGVRFDAPLPPGQPYPLTLSICGTVTFPYDVDGAHTIAVDVVDEDGHPPIDPGDGSRLPLQAELQVQFDPARTPRAGEEPVVPFAFNLVAAPFAHPGRFQVSLLVDAVSCASRSFTITAPTLPPQTGSGPTAFRLPGV